MAVGLRYIQPKLFALSNGLFANWMPDSAVAVGDFGVLRNGGFERWGTLRDYGADFEVKPATSGRNELEFKDRIDVAVNAAAGLPGDWIARINLQIRGKGSFLYHLSDVHLRRPVSERRFQEEVARALVCSDLLLPDDVVLVTEVQHAAKATIIASDHDEGRLELVTNFSPIGAAFLSGAKGKVSVSLSMGSIFSWIARDDTVTLIRLVRPKLLPPGGGPDAASIGALGRVMEWARELVAAQGLRVSDLIVRPAPGKDDTVIVAIGYSFLSLALAPVPLADLMATIVDERVVPVLDEPVAIAVPEQAFGKRMMMRGDD